MLTYQGISPHAAALLISRLCRKAETPVARAAEKHERVMRRVFLTAVKKAQADIHMGDLEDALKVPGTGAALYVLQPVIDALVEQTKIRPHETYIRTAAARKQTVAEVLSDTMAAGADAGEMCVTVFHGTKQAALESIMKEGIRPDKQGFAWATSKLSDAQSFAYTADEAGLSGVVLKIQAPASAYEKVYVGAKGEEHMRAKFAGHIKPEWIKGVAAKIEHQAWKVLTAAKPSVYLPIFIDIDGNVVLPEVAP